MLLEPASMQISIIQMKLNGVYIQVLNITIIGECCLQMLGELQSSHDHLKWNINTS